MHGVNTTNLVDTELGPPVNFTYCIVQSYEFGQAYALVLLGITGYHKTVTEYTTA